MQCGRRRRKDQLRDFEKAEEAPDRDFMMNVPSRDDGRESGLRNDSKEAGCC